MGKKRDLRVLKNLLRQHLRMNFRGRTIEIKSKASKIFDLNLEEPLAEYRLWVERWGVESGDNPKVIDITQNIPISTLYQ